MPTRFSSVPGLRQSVSRALLGGLAALALAASIVSCSRPSPDVPENVLLVLVDTLRQDRVSAYGYEVETTPVIDRLAASGAQLDALSPTSWTKPATASLLTGLHPLRHQALASEDRLPAQVRTLAEVLSQRGFQTAAISGNAWVSKVMGFDQGFDSLELVRDEAHPHGPDAERLNRDVRARLETLEPPFFLYVHYIDPHSPYDPPELVDGSPVEGDLAELAELSSRPRFFKGPPPPPRLEPALRSLYDGEVKRVDQAIGEVLEMLADKGWLDSTIKVVTSDHGEELLDHGHVGHGRTLYGEVTRVPLVLAGPGIPAGARLPRPVSLLDVFPTVLATLGVEDEEFDGVDGVDLLPYLRGQAESELASRDHLMILDSARHALALEKAGRRLLLAGDPYRKELYDLGNDPREQRDLARSEEASELFRELGRDLADHYNQLRREGLRRELADADDATEGQLEALGYLANTRKRTRRRIPHRIQPTDELPGGLLGWDDLRRLGPCVRPAEQGRLRLEGWKSKRDGGIWSGAFASLVLEAAAASSPRTLALQGRVAAKVQATLTLGGREIFRGSFEEGQDVSLLLDVPETLPAGPTVLAIDSETATDEGAATPSPSGILVLEACIHGEKS